MPFTENLSNPFNEDVFIALEHPKGEVRINIIRNLFCFHSISIVDAFETWYNPARAMNVSSSSLNFAHFFGIFAKTNERDSDAAKKAS